MSLYPSLTLRCPLFMFSKEAAIKNNEKSKLKSSYVSRVTCLGDRSIAESEETVQMEDFQ